MFRVVNRSDYSNILGVQKFRTFYRTSEFPDLNDLSLVMRKPVFEVFEAAQPQNVARGLKFRI